MYTKASKIKIFFFSIVLISMLVACAGQQTEAPAAVTEAPAAVTEAPAAVTEAPAAVTEAPSGGGCTEFTTVKMNYWPGPESEAMAKVIEYYNANVSPETCVKVEMILFSRDNHFTKLESIMAAGSDEVDTFELDTSRFGKYIKFLEPLQEHFKDPAWNPSGGSPDTYIPSIIEYLSDKGNLYCLPMDFSIHFSFFRKDLMDQLLSDPAWQAKYKEISKQYLGKEMEPKNPEDWTWEDFLATAFFFTQKYNPDSPTKYGTLFQARGGMASNIMLYSTFLAGQGGAFFDENMKPTIDTPEDLATLEFVNTLRENELVPPGFENYEYPEANEAFKTGNVATMIHWNAAFNELNNPELSPITGGKTGITHPPAGPDGPRTFVNSLSQCLNVNSKNKEAAFKFLSWLARPESMEMYAQNGGIPPVVSVLSGMADTHPDFPLLAEYADKYAFRIGNNTTTPLEIIGRNLSGAWVGLISPEEALKTTQDELMQWYNEQQQ